MLMERIFAIVIILLAALHGAYAQQESADTAKVSLKGRVVDDEQEPVSLCIVRVEGQGVATTASLEGN